MKRTYFLIAASLVLCLLPVLGTLAENHAQQQPHNVVQLHTDPATRHN